jgi:hypothetical protein
MAKEELRNIHMPLDYYEELTGMDETSRTARLTALGIIARRFCDERGFTVDTGKGVLINAKGVEYDDRLNNMGEDSSFVENIIVDLEIQAEEIKLAVGVLRRIVSIVTAQTQGE